MVKTLIGYPDGEPSRKALILARVLLGGGAAYVAYRKRDAIGRIMAVAVASPLAVRQLAILLTRLGVV